MNTFKNLTLLKSPSQHQLQWNCPFAIKLPTDFLYKIQNSNFHVRDHYQVRYFSIPPQC